MTFLRYIFARKQLKISFNCNLIQEGVRRIGPHVTICGFFNSIHHLRRSFTYMAALALISAMTHLYCFYGSSIFEWLDPNNFMVEETGCKVKTIGDGIIQIGPFCGS
jgi:hypothetical protein